MSSSTASGTSSQVTANPAESGSVAQVGIGHELLVVRNVSKRFGITQALADVSVTMRAGEVHALMGENGAGKSTLGKAIAGLHKPDTGTISVAGRELELGSIHDATEAGIRIVHQELAQCPNLTVAENLCLHDLPRRSGLGKFFGAVDSRAMNQRAAKLLIKLAPEIDVEAPLGTLAPGRRQIVQIASSLDTGDATEGATPPRIIIFDEPTSSLSVAEADRLMAIVRDLASQGLLCVYVSHRMNEIFGCCDRITVLRDGRFVATSVIKETAQSTIISQMIGRTLDTSQHNKRVAAAADASQQPLSSATPGKWTGPMLEVRGLTSPGRVEDVSLSVRAGEIVGIGGLVGAGRSETLDAIFGLDPAATGSVLVEGQPLRLGSARAAIAAGVGYVPEDRRLQGLFFDLGVDENIVMPLMALWAKLGLRTATKEKSEVGDRLARLRVKTAGFSSTPGELSGGNQQKLLLARWMDARTKVLLLDEPTRGIDVGTKAEIYKLIWQAASSGLAVLLVSSEMPELLLLSDRVLVMSEGRITGELRGEAMTQEGVMTLATGNRLAAV